MQLATRVQELTPSLTLAIDSKAKALKAEGIDVCGFGAGEPDMDTPEHIKAACIEAIQAGFTKYTPSSGMPELRQAISEKFKNDNNLEYKPSQIIVSNGAKQSCFNAVAAVCDPGDEVIIPAPYWLSYPEMVRLAGAEPVIVQTTEQGRLEDDCGAIRERHDAQDEDDHHQFARQPDGLGLHQGGAARDIRSRRRRGDLTFSRTKSTRGSLTRGPSMSASPHSRRRPTI